MCQTLHQGYNSFDSSSIGIVRTYMENLRMKAYIFSGQFVLIISFNSYSYNSRLVHNLLNNFAVFANNFSFNK